MAIPERLAEVLTRSLSEGAHKSIQDGMCVMEAASYVSGEQWSDAPSCACPVISSFLRSWNDRLPSDAERDRLLKPLIAEIIGTRSTRAVEERRSYMALDWLIRVHAPAWLDRVDSLKPHALALRSHEEMADLAGATAAGEKVHAAAAAARDAAGAAATAAAWDAATEAATAAAWDAPGAAATAAAWAAARAALKPTVDELQASSLELVRRMILVQS